MRFRIDQTGVDRDKPGIQIWNMVDYPFLLGGPKDFSDSPRDNFLFPFLIWLGLGFGLGLGPGLSI